MAQAILLGFGAYFFGAIPTAYLVARLVRGVDLRQFGSGAVTSSNVGELLGKWAAASVGVTDILKGAAPIWAARALDLGLAEQMAIGLATIAGHNWSVFLRFHGGRGLTIVIGVLLAAAPMELLLFALVAIFGVTFFRNVPLFLGLATLLLPVWSFTLEEEAPLLWGTGIMVTLVIIKRLTGNRLDGLPPKGKFRVLLTRLLYDRDIRDRETWVRRGPSDPVVREVENSRVETPPSPE